MKAIGYMGSEAVEPTEVISNEWLLEPVHLLGACYVKRLNTKYKLAYIPGLRCTRLETKLTVVDVVDGDHRATFDKIKGHDVEPYIELFKQLKQQ